MQDAIDQLVATTFEALTSALRHARLDGAPLVQSRSVDRAIEALAGYAIGVFAAGVAQRLSLGADLAGAAVIRAALYRATSPAQLDPAPEALDLDALLDGEALVTDAMLRARVADRLRRGRADARRIVTALAIASAAEPSWLVRVLGELSRSDLVATRFAEQIERVWALLHGGTTYVAPPKPRLVPIATNYCEMQIR